jgi:heme/copper-type cytochrome/quinol oxidase subunit 2
MAYNWNGELNEQRKHRLVMHMSLGLSAISFIAVIAMLAYFLAHRDSTNQGPYFPQSNWHLRS